MAYRGGDGATYKGYGRPPPDQRKYSESPTMRRPPPGHHPLARCNTHVPGAHRVVQQGGQRDVLQRPEQPHNDAGPGIELGSRWPRTRELHHRHHQNPTI